MDDLVTFLLSLSVPAALFVVGVLFLLPLWFKKFFGFEVDPERRLHSVTAGVLLLATACMWLLLARVSPVAEPSSTEATIPIGSIITFGGPLTSIVRGNLLEMGWLPCDGEPIGEGDFPELYGLLGSHFGQEVDGRRRLPDFRGRVPVGAGQGSSLTLRELGGQLGTETHTLSVEQIPSHSHLYHRSHKDGPNVNDQFAKGDSENARHYTSQTGTTGGGQPHPIVQPSLVVNVLIKAKHN